MDGTPRNELAQLILDVRYGRKSLTESRTTEGLKYSGPRALALIRAHQKIDPESAIQLNGEIGGSLRIEGSIGGDLNIDGSIDDGLVIWGSSSVVGDLNIEGTVAGNLYLGGWKRGSADGDLELENLGWGSIGGDLNIEGSVGGEIFIQGLGSVTGDFIIEGSVHGGLHLWGSVGRHLELNGSVGGDLSIWNSGSVNSDLLINGSVDGDLNIQGSVGRDFVIGGAGRGSVAGNIAVSGSVGAGLYLGGSVGGQIDLVSTERLDVGSFAGSSFKRPVFLGESVGLSGCDFRNFGGFEQLRFVGSTLFSSEGSKRISHTTPNGDPIGDVELAGIYRQLRQVYERQSNRAEAGDFYYQEMNARRRASYSERRVSAQWFVLSAYWLVSGYAQRSWRAIAWFVGVALFAAGLFLIDGFDPASNGTKWIRFVDSLEFSVRSMVSFFSPPEGELARLERWGQLCLRFTGPTILAQAILAIREKVAR